MRFIQTPLAGAWQIELQPASDERGSFARIWCEREFLEHGIDASPVQSSISRNLRRGTLRGMHIQVAPSRESKLVRCTSGSVFDVIVDLRPGSDTFLLCFGVELDARRGNALFIPPLFAHGFQTLADDTDVVYQMSDFHAPELAAGWRWNDRAFGIRWPIDPPTVISVRDQSYPDFDLEDYLCRCTADVSAGRAVREQGRER